MSSDSNADSESSDPVSDPNEGLELDDDDLYQSMDHMPVGHMINLRNVTSMPAVGRSIHLI